MLDSLNAFIGQLSYLQIGLIIGTMVLAGFVRGFVGFGASLIIVMVLSLVLEPLLAVPISMLSGLPVGAQLLPNAIRFSEKSFVVPYGVAAFAAAPVGAVVLVSLDATIMKMTISVFVLVMVALMYGHWRPSKNPGLGVYLSAGAISGLLQGAAAVGGPPAVAVALSRPGTPQQQRANVIGAVTALSMCALLPVWYYGLFTSEVIFISIAVTPFYMGATWGGARFFSLQGQRYFRNGALAALAIIGLITLTISIQEFLTH
jgi:uncharacterized membrane protein YfcA